MANNKPRGSQTGLLQNREDTKRQNTEAMWKEVVHLRKDKPDATWTFKEVWSGAGLKSNVALNSPWNSHIREVINEHNQKIRENIELGPVGVSRQKTLRTTNRELRQQLDALKKERDKALSQIGIYEAEADFYTRENEVLKKIKDRQSKEINACKKELMKIKTSSISNE